MTMAPHNTDGDGSKSRSTLSSPTPQSINYSNPQRIITLPLLRKRSEHNEGLVSSLEELALHQEELQSIGPVLGRTCGKTLKILLLQNNVIGRMDPSDLKLFRSLEYLNLALNNVTEIEGVGGMEWLRKLDLTLNFVDLDALERSVDELSRCRSLEELFLLGNPCMGLENDGLPAADSAGTDAATPHGWNGCRAYIVARLTNLQSLDGREIKRSERILATQQLPNLAQELHLLAKARKEKRQLESIGRHEGECCEGDEGSVDDRYVSDDAPTHHNPDTRTKMSNELYDQKQSKENQEKSNQPPKPKGEKEWDDEHNDTVWKARERESSLTKKDGGIKQCNQGQHQFWFEEESHRDRHGNKAGSLILRVAIPKYLSTSLIDVDLHPNYVSLVIKSKILRVLLPVEVQSDRSVARRSAASGYLELVMPKTDPHEVVMGLAHVRESGKNQSAPRTRPREGSKEADFKETRERLGQSIMKEAGHMHSLKIVNQGADDTSDLVLSSCDDEDNDEPPPLY